MATWVCSACGGENPEGTKFCGHCGAPAVTSTEPAPPDEHEIAEALRSFVAGPVAEKLVEAGGYIPEERRLITALFADVSGFTSLADRLDPEHLLEVIDPVISGLSSVVGRYGGYVEKFAGDALMALFGAPVSHEDDATRALRTALEMHEELARLVVELPHDAELTLHVGVNSGHGIARILGSEARMDYAVLGDSVILAQRLESAAPPGETFVSETTVLLTEAEFEFEPVGELTLKGKAEPVPAWRLLGPRERRPPTARPALIGREAELGMLENALTGLAQGIGGVIAITGEPGIGKSRLVDAATDRAVTIGAQQLNARCISYGAGLPYWPYLDLLRRATGLRTDERPDETRARLEAALGEADAVAPVFARLLGLPVRDERVSALEPEAFRRALHEAFVRWARTLERTRPLVLVVEDIHWIDASSLELTAELVQLAQTHAVLVILVGRPEAREQIWAAAEDPPTVELGPFDRDAIALLAEAILGGTAPDALVGFVERRTSGNPLFVQELIRTLRDADALVPAERGWEIRPGWDERRLPPTIEGVVAARIDLLPREAAAVLQTASVIGRRMRVDLLAAVVGDTALDAPVAELIRSGFLDRATDDGDAVVAFHHALVQDAAYSRLLRRRRRELHLRVADVAESLYGSGDHVVDLLARHRYLGGSPKAHDYLVRAGRRARHLFANEEAILHFTRAVELDADDVESTILLADLHELVGNYDDALALYEQVRSERNDLRAWVGKAATLRKRGRYIDALATVDEAFTSEPLRGLQLDALWLEAGWTLLTVGHTDTALDVLFAGIEAAHPRRDAAVARLLLTAARAEAGEGKLDPALDHAHEAVAMAEEDGDTRTIVSALRVLGGALWYADRLDEAADILLRGLALAQHVGSSEEIAACLGALGLIEKRRRNYSEAILYSEQAIEEYHRAGHASGRAQGLANLAGVYEESGDLERALVVCTEAEEAASLIGYRNAIADVANTRAMVAMKRKQFNDAGEIAERAAGLYLDIGSTQIAQEMFVAAADAWRETGETERARACDARARELTVA